MPQVLFAVLQSAAAHPECIPRFTVKTTKGFPCKTTNYDCKNPRLLIALQKLPLNVSTMHAIYRRSPIIY